MSPRPSYLLHCLSRARRAIIAASTNGIAATATFEARACPDRLESSCGRPRALQLAGAGSDIKPDSGPKRARSGQRNRSARSFELIRSSVAFRANPHRDVLKDLSLTPKAETIAACAKKMPARPIVCPGTVGWRAASDVSNLSAKLARAATFWRRARLPAKRWTDPCRGRALLRVGNLNNLFRLSLKSYRI